MQKYNVWSDEELKESANRMRITAAIGLTGIIFILGFWVGRWLGGVPGGC